MHLPQLQHQQQRRFLEEEHVLGASNGTESSATATATATATASTAIVVDSSIHASNATFVSSPVVVDNDAIDYRYMTNAMYIGLVSTGVFSCLLSLAGSASILYFILISSRRRRRRRSSSHGRIKKMSHALSSSAHNNNNNNSSSSISPFNNKRRFTVTLQQQQQQQQATVTATTTPPLSQVQPQPQPQPRRAHDDDEVEAASPSNPRISSSNINNNNNNQQVVPEKLGLYHRLMVGLSIMDFITSFFLLLQPILVPDFTQLTIAVGNTATCRLAGFWFQFYNGSFLYSATLSVYFYLTIRRGKKEHQAAALLEPHIHVLCVFVPCMLGVLGLVFDLIRPGVFLGSCDIGNVKSECMVQHNNKNNNTIRLTEREDLGEQDDCVPSLAETVITWLPAMITIASVLIGMVATFLVYWTVRQQGTSTSRNFRRQRQPHGFVFPQQQQLQLQRLSETQQQRRTRHVGRQAILYFLAYLNGFVLASFASMTSIAFGYNLADPAEMKGNIVLHVAAFVIYLFFPLQGFFNGIIFLRPRIIKWKEMEPEQSYFWCYRQVVLSGYPPPRSWQQHQQQQAAGAAAVRLGSGETIRTITRGGKGRQQQQQQQHRRQQHSSIRSNSNNGRSLYNNNNLSLVSLSKESSIRTMDSSLVLYVAEQNQQHEQQQQQQQQVVSLNRNVFRDVSDEATENDGRKSPNAYTQPSSKLSSDTSTQETDIVDKDAAAGNQVESARIKEHG